MDLPERTLSNKISSRLGLHRITFKGYTHAQLIQIIESRLANVPGGVVHPDAIQFASRKVAAVSGDARRCLDICRRAVEIAEAEAASKDGTDDKENAPGTPSKTGRGSNKKPFAVITQKSQPIVTIATIKAAINEATSSPLQQSLRSLPLTSKIFLAALLARIRRTGVSEALLGDILDESRNLAIMADSSAVHEILLLQEATRVINDSEIFTRTPKRRRGEGGKAANVAAARVQGMEGAVLGLVEGGIVGVESRRGERARRVRLGVNEEEVRLALKDDDEVRGMGFGT
jgi:origin recognition complex subunit 1